MMTFSQVKELLDRLRRIETRATKFYEFMGFDTETRKPWWRDGEVHVTSRAVSLNDCLTTVPPDWPPKVRITVVLGDDVLCYINLV